MYKDQDKEEEVEIPPQESDVQLQKNDSGHAAVAWSQMRWKKTAAASWSEEKCDVMVMNDA